MSCRRDQRRTRSSPYRPQADAALTRLVAEGDRRGRDCAVRRSLLTDFHLQMAQVSRRARVRPSERLPGLLRAARIAEVLFFPAACFMLLALPVPRLDRAGEVWAYLIIAAEAFAAAAVYVGLGRRRLWAWVLGMVLAAWVLTGVVRAGRIFSLATLPGNGVLIGSIALFAWTMLAQLVVLGCCLAFIPRRGELR
jgi:hypothetical protein